MKTQFISLQQLIIIVIPLAMGTIARFLTLKQDIRQYPSYPNGYLINIITGLVAASLGAVAIPAIVSKNLVAVTWLGIAIQQFREVRKMETSSLTSLEGAESTYRGAAYIDGIGKTLEARNYVCLIVSISVSLTMYVFYKIDLPIRSVISIILGLIVIYILKRFTTGKVIGDIATVKEGKIEIKGSELFVDGIYISNLLGTENSSNMYRDEGIAVVITPNEQHFRITLDNFGQRQAALFEATKSLGVKRYSFTRKNYVDGKIVVTLVPIIKDIDTLINVVEQTPLLESIQKNHKIMKTKAVGRR